MIRILPYLSLGPDAREEDPHGTVSFPCAIYRTALQKQPDGLIPEHWHGEAELGYVERGVVAFSCGGQEHILCEDDAYFIRSSGRHSMTERSEDSVFFSIVFHEDMLTGPGAINEKYVYPVIRSRDFPFILLQDPFILSTLKTIVSLGDEQTPGYELLIRNHLSSIILWICRRYHMMESVPVLSESSVRIEKMLSFMADHYMEDIQVKQIADHAFISVRECYRAFRTELNSSPTDYLRQYRLKKAADLLISTDLSIVDVAERCGYHQAGYFSTRFKEMYLCSPSEYRRINQQENS